MWVVADRLMGGWLGGWMDGCHINITKLDITDHTINFIIEWPVY